MGVEAKDLFVGGKIIVIKTEGEFDAFEALVTKVAVTRKSATVIRVEHADQAMKEHGASWMHMVMQAEENKDLMRATLDEMYKATPDVNKFIQEFKALSDARVEITKKMEALANRYSFHVAGQEAAAKKKADEAKAAKKKGKEPKAAEAAASK